MEKWLTVVWSSCNQPSFWHIWTIHYHRLNSGCMSFQGLKRTPGPCWAHCSCKESKGNPGCRTLDFGPGQAFLFFKRIYFISPHFQHAIEYHVVSASHVHAPCFAIPLHFKGLSAHWKQSLGQKYKSNQYNWMHIDCRTWRASGIFSNLNNHTADKWGLSGSTCNRGKLKQLIRTWVLCLSS